jgi:hypothetical protein
LVSFSAEVSLVELGGVGVVVVDEALLVLVELLDCGLNSLEFALFV